MDWVSEGIHRVRAQTQKQRLQETQDVRESYLGHVRKRGEKEAEGGN